MKRRRHTPEQIIRKLREAERMLAEGKTIPEAAKALEVSENTFHRWRNQYGGMKADDAKRLKELEPSLPTSRETVMTKEPLSPEGEIGARDVVDGAEWRRRPAERSEP